MHGAVRRRLGSVRFVVFWFGAVRFGSAWQGSVRKGWVWWALFHKVTLLFFKRRRVW